jgi:methylenetetrahydrofolate dehydrogenase (NADP+)/methenyltetrahydrofolate cyclohydrolase
MAAIVLDGKAVADDLRRDIRAQVQQLADQDQPVKLLAVEVGEHPASTIYTNMQRRSCNEVGIDYELWTLDPEITERKLQAIMAQINEDPSITGLILQLPLPDHIDPRAVQAMISPYKDVEAINPANLGRLLLDAWHAAPCTAQAAIELLSRHTTDWAGKEVVIVGHSEIVGKPIAAMMLASRRAAPTVTVCHVATRDLAYHTRRADILFVAAGRAQSNWLRYQRALDAGQSPPPPDLGPLISREMIQPGAVIIDIAVNRIPRALDAAGQPVRKDNGKVDRITVGDVDPQAADALASAYTPVPGGVGPVTVAVLLQNTVACARVQLHHRNQPLGLEDE